MVVKEGVVHLFNRIAVMPELEGSGGKLTQFQPGGGGIFCPLFTSGIIKQDTFSELRKREM